MHTHPHTFSKSTLNPYQLGSDSRCLIQLLLTVKQSTVQFVPCLVQRLKPDVMPEECSRVCVCLCAGCWSSDAGAQIWNSIDCYLSIMVRYLFCCISEAKHYEILCECHQTLTHERAICSNKETGNLNVHMWLPKDTNYHSFMDLYRQFHGTHKKKGVCCVLMAAIAGQ